MEISLREWLIIGGIVMIALILFDGWRRVRASRNSLKIDIDKSFSGSEISDTHNPELPNGGARVRSFNADAYPFEDMSSDSTENVNEPLSTPTNLFDNEIPTPPAKEQNEEEQRRNKKVTKAATERKVPLKQSEQPQKALQSETDSVTFQVEATRETSEESKQLSHLDPLFDDIPSDLLQNPSTKRGRSKPKASDQTLNLFTELGLDQPFSIDDGLQSASDLSVESRELKKRNSYKELSEGARPQVNDLFDMAESDESELLASMSKQTSSEDVKSRTNKNPDQEASSSASKTERKALAEFPEPEEVLVITVVGRNHRLIDGGALKKVVEACGMEYGDMSIYHRFDYNHTPVSLQFSMANAVSPGTFDPETMSKMETPAVSFFMSMREPVDTMTAYECMLATAETLAKHLDGEMLDEDRSVMRVQTKEHYRQRIRDFEMQNRRQKRNKR